MQIPKPISVVEHTNYANPVVRVAISHNDRYLVIQEGKPEVRAVVVSGGKIDVGEMVTVAAKREVYEETGLTVELTGLLGTNYRLWTDRPGYTSEFHFLAKVNDDVDLNSHEFPHTEEVMAYAWKTLAELRIMVGASELRNSAQIQIVGSLERGEVLSMEAVEEE